MPTANIKESFPFPPAADEKHPTFGGSKKACYLEMALTICSMLAMAGFCALCTIFFSYSGAFVLHVCLAVIGGSAALIAVLTHSGWALFLHMLVQLVCIVYLLIIAVLSISIFLHPMKWKFDNAQFLGHSADEIRKSGAILMIFSILLIPILATSFTCAVQLFRQFGREKPTSDNVKQLANTP